MQVITYDGTFQGFLSAVFEIYEYRIADPEFSDSDTSLFGGIHTVTTSEQNAERVWKGLMKHISKTSVTNLYHAFLSEGAQIEQLLYRYIKYVFESKSSVDRDYSHPAVLEVSQIAKKVHRERHRMEAFIRFKLTADALYYCVVEPDFDVLPLLVNHFRRRYADQRWMIYDTKRKYGIHYDLKTVTNVTFDVRDPGTADAIPMHDEKEELYQRLWRNYFQSVNIASRRNMKLHIKHMPYRYWKYLTEKDGPHPGHAGANVQR